MGRYYQVIGRQLFIVLALLFAVSSLTLPSELHAQTKKGLQMKTAGTDTSQMSATAEEGMPERGRFQFWYSYSGESIDATIQVSKNGTVIGEQSGMSPVTDVLLADATIEKGDVIVVSSHFKDSHNSGAFGSKNVFGHSAGLWYSFGNGAFYALDQEGNIIEVFGTWDFNLALTPPWNGIEVTADPESISPGDSSSITLQPYETPSQPVIIPDGTFINLQTSFLGDLIGGFGLPEYGYRYVQGFNNAPWGLLKDTDILYEVHPSIEASDDFEIPVVAYSPYDTGINGSTAIEVKKETELEVSFVNPEEIEIWPTLGGGAYSGINRNENNIHKEIVVEVTRDGEPEPSKEVVVAPHFIPKTGGHDHSGQPPDSLRGEVIFLDDPITDSEGKVQFTYNAPKISGEYELIAQVAEDGTIYDDTKSVIVKVPQLDPLDDSSYLEKVGAPDNNKTTNDPCREPGSFSSTHYNNHHGTNKLNSAIRRISKNYYLADNSTKLRINDMSLEWGGFLDIYDHWTNPHFEHRIGKQADIGSKGIDKKGNCKTELKTVGLTRMINKETDQELLIHYNDDETIHHYHIRIK